MGIVGFTAPCPQYSVIELAAIEVTPGFLQKKKKGGEGATVVESDRREHRGNEYGAKTTEFLDTVFHAHQDRPLADLSTEWSKKTGQSCVYGRGKHSKAGPRISTSEAPDGLSPTL